MVIRGLVFNNRFSPSVHFLLSALQDGAVIVIAALAEPADGGVWFASSAGVLAWRC